MENRYASPCQRCGVQVEPGQGYVVDLNKWSSSARRSGTRWGTYCGDKAACEARIEAAQVERFNSPAAVAAREAAAVKAEQAKVGAVAVLAALVEMDPAVPVWNGKARTYTAGDGTVIKVSKTRDGLINLRTDGYWTQEGSVEEAQARLAALWIETSPRFRDTPNVGLVLDLRIARVRAAAIEAASADA